MGTLTRKCRPCRDHLNGSDKRGGEVNTVTIAVQWKFNMRLSTLQSGIQSAQRQRMGNGVWLSGVAGFLHTTPFITTLIVTPLDCRCGAQTSVTATCQPDYGNDPALLLRRYESGPADLRRADSTVLGVMTPRRGSTYSYTFPDTEASPVSINSMLRRVRSYRRGTRSAAATVTAVLPPSVTSLSTVPAAPVAASGSRSPSSEQILTHERPNRY